MPYVGYVMESEKKNERENGERSRREKTEVLGSGFRDTTRRPILLADVCKVVPFRYLGIVGTDTRFMGDDLSKTGPKGLHRVQQYNALGPVA